MIRIAISQSAFEAIARTLPLGSVSFENKTNERGERYVWLAPNVVDRLRFLRGHYSQVILRLAHAAKPVKLWYVFGRRGPGDTTTAKSMGSTKTAGSTTRNVPTHELGPSAH